MEIDQLEEESPKKSHVLQNLTANGGLWTSIAKLSGSSRIIPSNKDFHFYNNFQEFKKPLKETDEKSKTLLTEIGVLKNLYGKAIELPDDNSMELDDELALDWVVNVNDEIFERFDVSVDEFKSLRKKEEETGVRMMRVDDYHLDNGFQMVRGKKNKKLFGLEKNVEEGVKGVQDVKVATRMKPKIPFHIPTLTRPQDEFKIIVNNSNQPFEHVWLHRSEDGSRFIHPLEKLCVLDFIDRSENFTEPAEPPPIEVTPFKLVEQVKDLKQLASKLRDVDEFAVDLEHNQYRSFQGLTCLMQISTRMEDFVIDTLKLRIHIGPHLREVFKDPTKRKVMHGADNDILWLQRDFGIYVCNMFDTGQASRVLKLERFSLEYLLNHFCGVKANKEYQNADWRIRPLPHEMMKYAREDTHYLMYIYDVMRMRLLTSSAESDSSDPPLVEVYKRSYDICTQLYEKELLTDDSYLYIYGLHGAELNAQQLAVVSGLCEWRDVVARAEDESTGYVLPNRTLIELAKHMPLTASKLRWVLKSKHPFIEKNLGSIVSIIRHSIQNAAAFEETAEYLKKRRLEMANKENTLATEESEVLPSDAPDDDLMDGNPVQNKDKPQDIGHSNNGIAIKIQEFSEKNEDENNVTDGHTLTNMSSSGSGEVTVQVLKKSTRAFGALLGISTKRKFYLDKREQEDAKLGNIKSTVTLPFHTFTGKDEQLPSDVKESTNTLQVSPPTDISKPSNGSSFQDIIILGDSSDDEEESAKPEPKTPQLEQNEKNEAGSESEEEDKPISLSDLSSSFQKCLSSSINQTKSSKVVNQSQPSKVEPFDYESARKEVHFGKAAHETKKGKESDGNKNVNKKRSVAIESEKDEGMITSDLLPQGRRRQAFPASGNRSATFR